MHHDNSIVPFPVFMWTPNNRVGWLMQQKLKNRNMLVPTCTSTQSNQSQTTSAFLHDVSSDLLATPVSECLSDRCKFLYIIIERHMKTLNKLTSSTSCKTCLTGMRYDSGNNASFEMMSESSVPRQFQTPTCPIRHGPLLNSQSNQITLRRSLPCKANEE